VVALVDGLFRLHDATERDIALDLQVDGTRLVIDLAIPCGLIINELVTNSLKHAFRDRPGGVIRLILREAGSQFLELVVEDDGVGMPAELDPRNTLSLGLDLVFTFAEQLDARVEVRRDRGTRFQFTFPTAGPS
jgi:two-component sensor histidine kinase